MYVYIMTEPGLWTVGFYSPDGKWQSESDYSNSEEAAKRVAYLNGGPAQPIAEGRGGEDDKNRQILLQELLGIYPSGSFQKTECLWTKRI